MFPLSDFAVDASARAYYERLYNEASESRDAERADAEAKRRAALATFRRAMRRRERRARRMGANAPAREFRAARLDHDDADDFAAVAANRRECGTDWDRRVAFLYERAADAVARLRASQQIDRAAQLNR